MTLTYEIRPIRAEEWLPDRCMALPEPLDTRALAPQHGCPGLLFGGQHIRNRGEFEKFHLDVLTRFSCCGFMAWEKGKVLGYITFFPHEIARRIRFFGWGCTEENLAGTLVHQCISLVRNARYRRRGIGSALVQHALEWGKANNWKRYAVHRVLPESDKGITAEQKSALPFWSKFGFRVTREEEADAETRKAYGVESRYSLALELADYSEGEQQCKHSLMP